MKNLKGKAFGGVLSIVIALGVLLFLPAWTLDYWQAWLLLAVYGGSNLAIIIALMLIDTQLLERRSTGGPTAEQRTGQKVVMSLASLGFIAIFVVSALDHRFGWSSVPASVSIAGDVLVALGFLIIFFVFRVNTFASSTIGVAADQKVITTGPYAVVRHPMYSGSFLYMLGIPLALGSWWGIGVLLLITGTGLWRLFDEEHLLQHDLPGYGAYMQKVHYRLVPYVW